MRLSYPSPPNAGSGRSFTAYVFSKIAPAAATFLDAVEQGRAAPLSDLSSASTSSFASEASPSGRGAHAAGACGSEQEVEQEQQRRARQAARKSLGAGRLAGAPQEDEQEGRQGCGASATGQVGVRCGDSAVAGAMGSIWVVERGWSQCLMLCRI